jgi:hypothetical protein
MKTFLDGYSFSIEDRRGELYAVFNHCAEEMPDGRRSIPTQMRFRESVLTQIISDLKSTGETDTSVAEQGLEALHAAQVAKKSRNPVP